MKTRDIFYPELHFVLITNQTLKKTNLQTVKQTATFYRFLFFKIRSFP